MIGESWGDGLAAIVECATVTKTRENFRPRTVSQNLREALVSYLRNLGMGNGER